ncbi:hypothetical protein L7F22_058067 [Adiantum nelumboides]|nr:hypothetical protein [Adiantum nelumboides]
MSIDMEVHTIIAASSHLLLPAVILMLCLVGACYFLLHVISFSSDYAKRLQLPPGPRALPIIGHLHILATTSGQKLPHLLLDRLANKYGSLMWLKLGSFPLVVASSPATAQQLLQTHGRIFAARPRLTSVKHVLFDCAGMGFSSGSQWKLLRKLTGLHLLHKRPIDGFRSVLEEETKRLLLSVLNDSCKLNNVQSSSQLPTLRTKLLSFSIDIISRMALGQRLVELHLSSIDLIALIDELFVSKA